MKYEGLLVKPQLENKPDGFYISGTCFYYPVDNKQSKQTDKIKLGPYKIESEAIENLKKYTYEVETRVKETNKDMERLLKESSLLGKEMMGRVTKSTKNLAFLISDLEESKKALLGETKNSSNRTI